MVLVRRLRGRGAHGVVEIQGEALFAPGTDLSRWKNRFSQRVAAAARLTAPTNKRPRWAHYGKPLKSTITTSTSTRITKDGGMFFSAVGSTAHYSAYVDQGTGIYGGRGPYEAKILPPWREGSPSLYEHTWKPEGTGRRVGPVVIKGQRGQFFFDKALERGARSMRLRTYQVPGEGVSGVRDKWLQTQEPAFFGNTPADSAFVAQLEEWRAWRDGAWRSDRPLGEHGALTRNVMKRLERKRLFDEIRKERSARLARNRRARKAEYLRERRKRLKEEKAKNKSEASQTKPKTIPATLQAAMKASVAGWLRRHPGYTYTGRFTSTHFTVRDRNGNSKPVQWPVSISAALYDSTH